ncbi:M48 family metallopeptidase [Pantanalinema sp. GBBB05]|uniref:M48 family metallopeptidase n=1 Tax=Pantanalinema sp. GBBB05 TaxID=2604139 RepID=UPI001DE3DDAE|nr:M48 family metalloprotease [Pantanalinema sp. GBBB05]
MVKLFSSLSRRSRRWVYPFLSLAMVVLLVVGQPVVAQAISWGDLILRGIQVIQLSSMSDQQEVEIGKQINQELVGKGKVKLYRDPRITQYVETIGQRLAVQSRRPNVPYTFQVVDDSKVNAFATMGGFVYVNTGLLKLAENEAELASVMGHEIAHIAAKHSLKQAKEMAIASGLAGAAGVNRNLLINIGVELALRRPHSRQAEYEADQLGLETMRQAGYAPSAMVSFMKKLMGTSPIPTFLSTHPATEDRVTRLQQAIDPAQLNIGDGLDTVSYRERVRSLS